MLNFKLLNFPILWNPASKMTSLPKAVITKSCLSQKLKDIVPVSTNNSPVEFSKLNFDNSDARNNPTRKG